jgi:hypothetical protein
MESMEKSTKNTTQIIGDLRANMAIVLLIMFGVTLDPLVYHHKLAT